MNAIESCRKIKRRKSMKRLRFLSITLLLCLSFGVFAQSNFSEVLSAAQKGDIVAQVLVAKHYYLGEGVKKDLKKAFEWMYKAAIQGDTTAQLAISTFYFNGEGVEKSPKKAFEWSERAAIQGDAEAQHKVAFCYYWGIGVEKRDMNKAFEWTQKAAIQGYPDSQGLLSLFYRKGEGVEKDYKKGLEWALKYANQGFPSGMVEVGYYYAYGLGTKLDYAEAIRWYQKAIDLNFDGGYNDMACMYMKGHGVEQSFDKALELVNKAIELDPTYAGYYDTKGEIYARMGDKENALKIKAKIESINPQFLEIEKTEFYNYLVKWEKGGVDIDIPSTKVLNTETFAIIITAENYKRESKVPHANNDGNIFSEYCRQTLGIPEKNMKVIADATLNDIKYNINWIKNVMKAYNGEAKVIFYYAGHGVPDEANKTAYLLPIDGYGADFTTGYALKDLHSALSEMPAKSVVVFLDACFSGSMRDGEMLASARGVAIKVKEEAPKGNVVIFSAAKGDETAYPLDEEEHGMFTYFLLKKLKETKGDVTLAELGDYITKEVSRQSIVINGKTQTPTLSPSPSLGESWKTWKLR